MKKSLLFVSSIVFALALFAIPNDTYAGECFTGPVYLKDYQVKVKAAVYLRDGPCSDDNGTTARVDGQVASAGETVVVIASNHGWIKVKRSNGAIGWIWGPGWVSENVTEDAFASNKYESQMGYGLSDTHKEFAYLFGPVPGNDEYEDQETVVTEPTYALSKSMIQTLDETLDKVFAKVDSMVDTDAGKRSMYGKLITALTKIKNEKPAIAEMLRYLIDKITIEKNSL